MKILRTALVLAFAPTALAWSQGQTSQSSPPGGTSSLSAIGPFVRLQAGTPGAAQPGNSHITGTAMAEVFFGNSATTSGVVGYTSAAVPGLAGVYGYGPDNGVVGRNNSSSQAAVWGDCLGGGVGVHGASVFGSNGYGVLGQGSLFGTYGVSSGVFGAVGIGTQGVTGQGTYGLVSFGTAQVQGDLVVTGSKTGYVVDLIRNGDGVPLAPGEVVEIVGSEAAVLGDIPVAIVRRASSANARAVLGPISNALAFGPELTPPSAHARPSEGVEPRFTVTSSTAAPGILRVEGAILPGGYGNVVTLGAFRAIKVDARFGAIRAGDLLVASPEPGFAMSDPDPRTGTVIGKALASRSAGQGEIPVMVGGR